MKIRIYQINLERDIMRVAFSSYDQLEEMTGSPVAIDSSIYDLVYEGEVDCQDLEDVFRFSICITLRITGDVPSLFRILWRSSR